MMNLHFAFWNMYYTRMSSIIEDQDEKFVNPDLARKNRRITDSVWEAKGPIIPLQDGHTILLKTLYPGLAAGLGIKHTGGTKNQADPDNNQAQTEIQMGFSLDKVTGLPIIPGSSIKGVLRSAFIWQAELTSELLTEILGVNKPVTLKQLKMLELDIFGSLQRFDPREVVALLENAAAYCKGRDVFLDAYPVLPGKNGNLLGIDFVTSHLAKEPEYQGLTGPNPNAFLKLLPGVTLQFRFLLKDSYVTDREDGSLTVTADEKKALFTELLTTFGAGAKTNTGYGVLVPAAPLSGEAHFLVQKTN